MVDPCNRLHNFIVFLLPSIVDFQFCLMKHQSFLFSLFKGVIANSLNWLRALESMVMKKVKIKIKISFTPRPMEPEFQKSIICHKCIGYNLNVMRHCACFVTNPICCTL